MRQENTEISDRISMLIEMLGVNSHAFARALGYRRAQTIYDIVNGKSAPSFDFFNKLANSEYADRIDLHWLLTGRGSSPVKIPADKEPALPDFRAGFAASSAVVYPTASERLETPAADLRIPGIRPVPLYRPVVCSGAFARFEGAEEAPAGYLQIPGLPAADGAVCVWNDAMEPDFGPGDIVLFEWTKDPAREIEWGKTCLFALRLDGGDYVAIQSAEPAPDPAVIRLRSANDRYKPHEIPRAAVCAWASIRACVRCRSIE